MLVFAHNRDYGTFIHYLYIIYIYIYIEWRKRYFVLKGSKMFFGKVRVFRCPCPSVHWVWYLVIGNSIVLYTYICQHIFYISSFNYCTCICICICISDFRSNIRLHTVCWIWWTACLRGLPTTRHTRGMHWRL